MQPPKPILTRHPWLPYVAPFVMFMALTLMQPSNSGFIVWAYPLKTLLVGSALLFVMPSLPPLTVGYTGLAFLVGLVVVVPWVLLEGTYPYLGTPQAFDPFAHVMAPWVYGWIAVRIIGASVVVPVMEEFFWRGFLLRWIINADFRKVAIGTFSWPSFLLTTVLFASEHNRWLVGLIAGVAYNVLIYRTRSLYACIIAHGVTNLALGIYVLTSGEWSFW
jgi:CAAX prenyl protease-like protein